jgi:hypothetical protein
MPRTFSVTPRRGLSGGSSDKNIVVLLLIDSIRLSFENMPEPVP